jgi:hypothetical protein
MVAMDSIGTIAKTVANARLAATWLIWALAKLDFQKK